MCMREKLDSANVTEYYEILVKNLVYLTYFRLQLEACIRIAEEEKNSNHSVEIQ